MEWCQALLTADDKLGHGVCRRAGGSEASPSSAAAKWAGGSAPLLAPGTRCSLEHGGVAPVLVAADADFASMVPLLVKGGFYHAGQVCVSVQRVFRRTGRSPGLLAERLAAAAAALEGGRPARCPTRQVGPLIRASGSASGLTSGCRKP